MVGYLLDEALVLVGQRLPSSLPDIILGPFSLLAIQASIYKPEIDSRLYGTGLYICKEAMIEACPCIQIHIYVYIYSNE